MNLSNKRVKIIWVSFDTPKKVLFPVEPRGERMQWNVQLCFLKEQYQDDWLLRKRSTPLNASAFGVTLDSSVKSRPGQQTISTSPGRLQFGVIICYNKIKR